ncbi:MAG TPA: hypothetical protein VI793_07520 [Anaerolineales bacterium]|nr:hypothetical protein [Anaerolineales bacterium]
MSRVSALFRLQEIDLELDAHAARLRRIEAEMGDSPVVRAAQRKIVEAEAQIDTAHVGLRAGEQDIQALSEKIAEVEEQLYGGRVTNTKELQDLQRDVESLQRRRGALEEKHLEALIKVESVEAELAALNAQLSQVEDQAAQVNTYLVAEREKLRGRMARLEDEREAALVSVPAGDWEVYDRLRQAKKGRAVTRLEEGVCGACGVAPSSSQLQIARQGSELMRCPNCERIIYAE